MASGCRETELERALGIAGDNRQGLEQVLRHYKGDSLKLEAARFLISNMPWHSYKEKHYRSPGGRTYRPRPAGTKGKEVLERHIDSLAGKGYVPVHRKLRDIHTLDSTFLVNNIDLAFSVWAKPWAREVPFHIFCRYILPYRTSTERPSGLRRELMERFVPMLDSAKAASPMEACRLVNEKLGGMMKYGKTGLPFYPTIEETYEGGTAQCEGLCDLGLFAMRAAGIPVAMEQTVWTRMDLGHHWGAVWHGGAFHSFAPGEQGPGEHLKLLDERKHLRPAKVYRSHFDFRQPGKAVEDDGYVTWLKSPLLDDVTAEYLGRKAVDVRVETDIPPGKATGSGTIYLCTYNHYKWTPFAMGTRTGKSCFFRGVRGDNVFIVAEAEKGRLRFITAPFYINARGNVRKFVPYPERALVLTLPKRKDMRHVQHTLHYWDTGTAAFQPLECRKTTDSTQTYSNVPADALLWFTVPERIFNQRVFFVEDEATMELQKR